MNEAKKPEPPLIFVPLWPVLTPLLAVWCGLLDVSVIVAHLLTNGSYPSLAKVVVSTSITVAVNAYCFYTARQHRACRQAFRELVRDGIARPAITIHQAGIVVAALLGFTALWTWVFFFTSN
jgi:hypothetical protein